MELVAGTVLESGPESSPVAIGITGEEVLALGRPIAVFADEMNAQSTRRPDAEGRAAAVGQQEVRAHRSGRRDVGQWRGHGVIWNMGALMVTRLVIAAEHEEEAAATETARPREY